ncbi:MAG: type II toxin-antitoxin system HicA family toxin [Sarcina sp.]
MTSKELIKLLKKEGWVEKRQSGSHKLFVKEGYSKPVPIPFHNKDIPVGTLEKIKKMCGLK